MAFYGWLLKSEGPIDKEFLVANFYYLDGRLFYKKNDRLAGQRSATNGYYTTKIKGKYYCTHVLIWMMHFGSIPKGLEVDHIDRNSLNNKIDNLRLATSRQNKLNRSAIRNSRTGVKGVSWHKGNKKYVARITHYGEKMLLGYFDEIQDAQKAYEEASLKYHGEFNPASLMAIQRLIDADTAPKGE